MLIGVDVDPGESLERISSWAEGNGFFWQLAPVSAQPLKDYRISQQSAAIGIDAAGEIVLRKNGGLQGEDKWRDWLNTLAGRIASAQPEVPSTAASVPVAPAPVEAAPTAAPAPAAATAAPATQPVQPAPTAAVAAPTAAAATTAAPPPFAAPAPTITPSPIPTATPRPQPTATRVPTATPTPKPQLPLGSEVGNRAQDFHRDGGKRGDVHTLRGERQREGGDSLLLCDLVTGLQCGGSASVECLLSQQRRRFDPGRQL